MMQNSWLSIFTLAYLFWYGHFYHAWSRTRQQLLTTTTTASTTRRPALTVSETAKKPNGLTSRSLLLSRILPNKSCDTANKPDETPPPLTTCLDEHNSDDDGEEEEVREFAGDDDDDDHGKNNTSRNIKLEEEEDDFFRKMTTIEDNKGPAIYLLDVNTDPTHVPMRIINHPPKPMTAADDCWDRFQIFALIWLCLMAILFLVDPRAILVRVGTMIPELCRHVHSLFHPVSNIPLLQ